MPFATLALKQSSLAVLAAQNIVEPTPIQSAAIPVLLEGYDIIGQAQTGSGKTLAFGLPLIETCDPSIRAVQAIVLTPTRELAQQVAGVVSELARPAGLACAVLYGGVGMMPQVDALKRGAQIVVGTPGRVLDHLRQRSLDLSTVRLLVLDEADQMLDKGFAPDVERIISTTPVSRQTALFSATTPDWVKQVSARYLHEPVNVKADDRVEAEPDIAHQVVEVWDGDKLPVLMRLLDWNQNGGTLVFARTRHGVINLAKKLRARGYACEALQGDLSQPARDRIVARFRDGSLPIVLATNVAARGLDILTIDHVINYDLPETSELFVHRVGRTGRMGRAGRATTLITAVDLANMQAIERNLGRKLPRITINQIEATAPIAPPPLPAPRTQPIVQHEAMVAAKPAVVDPAKRRRRRRPRKPAMAAAPAI